MAELDVLFQRMETSNEEKVKLAQDIDDVDDRLKVVEIELVKKVDIGKHHELDKKVSNINVKIYIWGSVSGFVLAFFGYFFKTMFSELLQLLRVIYMHIGGTIIK